MTKAAAAVAGEPDTKAGSGKKTGEGNTGTQLTKKQAEYQRILE